MITGSLSTLLGLDSVNKIIPSCRYQYLLYQVRSTIHEINKVGAQYNAALPRNKLGNEKLGMIKTW